MSDGIKSWLERFGFGKYADAFVENEIDFRALLRLTEDDLKELGLPLGARRNLQAAIEQFSDEDTNLIAAAQSTKSTTTGEAERRQLTVMFCDLVGSTELSQLLDAEDLREVNRAYQDTCKAAIERYEGYVARYMGDGVLAYFGYPQAHEDDAERAVHSGLGVVESVAELKAAVGDKQGVELGVRVGIATGPVVVGDLIGEGASQESAVVGETPNLAARLQGLAEPDAVVISDSTRRLLGELFELQTLGPQTFKGIAEAVAVYTVVRERPIESRFEAHQGGAALELVGRDEELALLLRRWQQACQGEGQVALISGEAGIGKSRLLGAVGDALKGQPHYRINYQGSPYHTDSALHPAIQQLTRAAEFAAADSDEIKLDKLEALIGLAGCDSIRSAALIAALLGIDTGRRYGLLDLTPQQQRTQTLQALIAQLTGLAQRQPVFFVLEDAHWVDPTTLEFIELALAAVSQARVMLLLTARPSFEHRLVGYPIVTRLVLNRLSRESTVGIINRLTGGKALPDEVLDAIVRKTDGVPLFVEELTKTVLETGCLRESGGDYLLDGLLPQLTIPSTLQDSLMARLDRLSAAKDVAQTGACIGREFSHALLAAVSSLAEADFEAALTALTDSELVYRRGEPPEATYVFKHALVRDAAYESLLKSRRAMVHARIADRLNELFPEQAANEPELLAHHYGEAGLTAEAEARWVDAAKRATERSAHTEALAQLDRALMLLESLPRNVENSRRALDIQTLRAGALLATRGYIVPETIDAFEQARALCRELNEPPEVYRVLRGLCSIETMKGNLPAALAVAEECLHLGEAQDDSAPLSLGNRLVGQSCFMMGELVQARPHLEKAVELYEPERHRESAAIYGLDLRTGAAQILGVNLCLLGYPEQGMRVVQNTLQDARKLGFAFSLAVALEWANLVYMFRGDYHVAFAISQELGQLANEYEFDEYVDIARTNQGLTLALQELADRDTVAQLKRHIVSYQDRYGEFFAPYTLGLLGSSIGVLGSVDEGLDVIENAMVSAQRCEQHWHDAELHRLKGQLLLMDNEKESKTAYAEQSFERALAIARCQQAKWLELRAATCLGRLWQQNGKTTKARNLLAGVYHWFGEGFDTADLKDAKTLLEQLL